MNVYHATNVSSPHQTNMPLAEITGAAAAKSMAAVNHSKPLADCPPADQR